MISPCPRSYLGVDALSHLHATVGHSHRAVLVVDGDQTRVPERQVDVVRDGDQRHGALTPPVGLQWNNRGVTNDREGISGESRYYDCKSPKIL